MFNKIGGRTSKRRERHHYRFLGAVLTDPSSTRLRPYLEDECWDWEVLIKVAADELILPLLHDRLVNAIGLEWGPVTEFLRDVRDLHAERNEIVLDELKVLAELANRISIEPVVLKGGAHLLGGLYAAPSDRYLADIDLLIPDRAIPALVDHLLKNGYSFNSTNPVGADCHHEMCIKRPGRPGVELHRSVGMGRARLLLPAEEMIRDSVAMQHRGDRLRLPSDRHLLIHQVLHAQWNHSYKQAIWPNLREAYDCRLLVARLSASGSLPALLQEFQQDKRFEVVGLHLRTVQETMDKPIALPPLGVFTLARVHWLHRQLLRAAPALRFIDPYFFLRSSLTHRLYRLKGLGRSESGIRYALQTPFRRSFYRNVWKELF